MSEKKVVFIAHPLSGDVKGNAKKVLRICEEVHTREIIPCAPYLTAIQYLDDSVTEDREMGIAANLECFYRRYIDELWLFGDRISKGMHEEVLLALQLNIPIMAKTSGTNRDLLLIGGEATLFLNMRPSEFFCRKRFIEIGSTKHLAVGANNALLGAARSAFITRRFREKGDPNNLTMRDFLSYYQDVSQLVRIPNLGEKGIQKTVELIRASGLSIADTYGYLKSE